jgi:2-amino-4-hydroxy-6-hydroxymethyldihydropteridine diphosphokinase
MDAAPFLSLASVRYETLVAVPTAYISLGSNLGDREQQLRRAIALISERLGMVEKTSSFYDTAPVGITDQPRFLNGVLKLQTELPPEEVMRALLSIERELGRDRAKSIPKGPRTIDLDLLLYDNLVVSTPELTVPHPAMHERTFVLEPLAEIAPDAIHPVFIRSVAELLGELKA